MSTTGGGGGGGAPSSSSSSASTPSGPGRRGRWTAGSGGRGAGRGGGARGRGGGGYRGGPPPDRKRESILDLSKYSDKPVLVKFLGGREVAGILCGFDPLTNLVLDNTEETLRESGPEGSLYERKRTLGLVVARGPSVLMISPHDGVREISNPFWSASGTNKKNPAQ